MSADSNRAGQPGRQARDDVPSPDEAPLLQVVRGNPSTEELSALTAVVLGLAAPAEPSRPRPQRVRSWMRRRQLRLQPAPGPGAWRRSGR
ncbi:acyl-CoA carboxylase subunit epsilon [Arthrobacter castelli]|uniref:acyl-CoA carboxylase subunit epsilon n=1 Tax=Arthrobacter castelli TaxID=271431 RepID=UPI00042010E3|nr:acyl-CoA carboxylase subunit epsilon [Arthrobacter castelli]